MTGFRTALVLAGSRRGTDDDVARAGHVSHKALTPVNGRPMLAYVVEALDAVPGINTIMVAIERPDLVLKESGLRTLVNARRLAVVATADTPSRTVRAILDRQPGLLPLVITTGDHPLLTPQLIETFCAGVPPNADVAVGLARKEIIQAAYPETQRTYLRFRDASYSGCNLFVLRTEKARPVVDLWTKVERHRKHPLRMMALLGAGTMMRFAVGRLTLAIALEEFGCRTGAHLAAVELPFPEAAIDVDRLSDLALAESILRQRSTERPVR